MPDKPDVLESQLRLPRSGDFTFHPLRVDDVARLHEFLTSLSPTSREIWMVDGYTPDCAGELCDAIGRKSLDMIPELN
jgi:hypothetical protein